MSILRSIDLFGAKFSFTIFGNNHYNTTFGGILTLLVYCAIIVLSFMFGHDLVTRDNPKVIIERVVPNNYSYIDVNISNFPIFWNINDDDNTPKDITNYLFPESKYYYYKYNNSMNNFYPVDKKLLPNKKCTREMVQNENIFNQFGLDNYYCLDWKDSGYPIGGTFDGTDKLYYFEQTLYRCPHDNFTSPNCTNTTFLKNWLGQSSKFYYNIIYPHVYFAPGNYTNPIQIKYKMSFEQLSVNLIKKKRYFFSKVELQQDRGYIFESNYKSNLITLDYTENEIDYKSDDDLNDPSQSTSI